jgi:hypothetical protein
MRLSTAEPALTPASARRASILAMMSFLAMSRGTLALAVFRLALG